MTISTNNLMINAGLQALDNMEQHLPAIEVRPNDDDDDWGSLFDELDEQENMELGHYENLVSLRVADQCQFTRDDCTDPHEMMRSVEQHVNEVFDYISERFILENQTSFPAVQERLRDVALEQVGRQRRYGYGIYAGSHLKSAIKDAFKIFPDKKNLIVINHLRTIYPENLIRMVPNGDSTKIFDDSNGIRDTFCAKLLKEFRQTQELRIEGQLFDTLRGWNDVYDSNGMVKDSLLIEPHLQRDTFRNDRYQMYSNENPGTPARRVGGPSFMQYIMKRQLEVLNFQRYKKNRVQSPMFQPRPVGIEFQNYKNLAIRMLVNTIDVREELSSLPCIILWQDFSGSFFCDINEPVSPRIYEGFHGRMQFGDEVQELVDVDDTGSNCNASELLQIEFEPRKRSGSILRQLKNYFLHLITIRKNDKRW